MDIEIIDIGNTVLCDFCNMDYTESDEPGGCLMGSYAICPRCTPKLNKREVDVFNLPTVPFRKFVLKIRGGDNTIKIVSF
jgi:hypothetical protein